MIVKMIQNLRNSVDTQIEKRQEKFSPGPRRTKEQKNSDEKHNN